MTQRADQISRRLKLRQLEVLIAVARSGNMKKAAGQLTITQPVVSKTIADLEETVGMRLFDKIEYRAPLEESSHGPRPLV